MSDSESDSDFLSVNDLDLDVLASSSLGFGDDADESDSCDESEETDSKAESPIQIADKLCSKKFGHVTVTITKGDIAQQKTDVVVCGAPGRLDLKRSVMGKSLLKKAGDSLQKECKEKYPSGIKAGDIAMTGSHNLPCKQVYHVCLPKWEGQQSRNVLSSVINKCLTEASSKNYKSIAFPALGTGKLGYNNTVVAKVISTTVDSFSKQHTDSSLKDVICVIYPSHRSLVKTFTEIFRERLDSPTATDTTPRVLSRVQFGNISVKLTVGKLTEQQCDVIVGTCTRTLELSKGSLSKAILEVAGPGLQTECSSKYPQGIKHGEVAVLSPGNMSCTGIYLGAPPRYDKTPQDADKTPVEILKSIVTGCLQQAVTDRKSTMCLPTFGTGFLRYPPQISAKSMLEAISDFNTNNRGVTMTLSIVLHAERSNLQKNQKSFMKIFQQYSTSSGSNSPCGASSQPERFTPEFCVYMYSITSHHPPEYWTHYTNMKPLKDWQIDAKNQPCYQLVDIDTGQVEFQTIHSLVLNTWERKKVGHGRDASGLDQLDFNGVKVTKVQRVENLPLYEKYVNRRAELFHKAGGNMFTTLDEFEDIEHGGIKTEEKLSSIDSSWLERLYGEVNEGYFFHGTKADRVENLLKQGIDVRMAQGGAVYGQAVYMAESSTKADQYTDERDNRRMTGLQMFLCKACLGEIKVMKKVQKFRRPPCKEGCDGDKCSHDRYDSIVEENKFIFREFVLYDTHQAYPEYIITYDRVKLE